MVMTLNGKSHSIPMHLKVHKLTMPTNPALEIGDYFLIGSEE